MGCGAAIWIHASGLCPGRRRRALAGWRRRGGDRAARGRGNRAMDGPLRGNRLRARELRLRAGSGSGRTRGTPLLAFLRSETDNLCSGFTFGRGHRCLSPCQVDRPRRRYGEDHCLVGQSRERQALGVPGPHRRHSKPGVFSAGSSGLEQRGRHGEAVGLLHRIADPRIAMGGRVPFVFDRRQRIARCRHCRPKGGLRRDRDAVRPEPLPSGGRAEVAATGVGFSRREVAGLPVRRRSGAVRATRRGSRSQLRWT